MIEGIHDQCDGQIDDRRPTKKVLVSAIDSAEAVKRPLTLDPSLRLALLLITLALRGLGFGYIKRISVQYYSSTTSHRALASLSSHPRFGKVGQIKNRFPKFVTRIHSSKYM